MSAILTAWATATAFVRVKSDSANKRLWMAALLMLQTSLSHSMSSNISPYAQRSANLCNQPLTRRGRESWS